MIVDKSVGLMLSAIVLCGAASAQTYSGDYLEVKMNPEHPQPPEVRFNHFQLTNNLAVNGNLDTDLDPDSGSLVVTRQSTGPILQPRITEVYSTKPGNAAGEFESLLPLLDSLSSSRVGKVSGDEVQAVNDVVEQNFVRGVKDNCGECNLAGTNGDNDNIYVPKGQIISGYESPERNNKRLHLCTRSAPEQVVFSNSKPYKCDTKGSQVEDTTELWRTSNDARGGRSGDWDPVPRCQDGFDNDGDGDEDYPEDDGCKSLTDGTETFGDEQTCGPFIGRQDTDKVAFYDSGQGSSNPLGKGCNYRVQEAAGSGILETFRCTQQGDAKATGGGALDLANDAERAARGFCSAVGNRENHLHSGNQVVRSVIFSYDKADIPYSPKAENQEQESVLASRTSQRANEFVEDTDFNPSGLKRRCANKTLTPGTDRIGRDGFVYDGGFVLRRCETVHHAETEYTNGDPHAASVWRSRGMANLEDGYSESDRPESWVAAKPGGISDGVEPQGQGGTIQDLRFFEGGFAGRCPSDGQWQYVTPSGPLYNTISSTGLWRCGNPSQINVDFFELNVRDYGEKHVGFRVTGQDITQWKGAFFPEQQQIELDLKMDAACWPGRRNTLTNADDSVNTNLLTNITVDLNADSDTVAGLKLKNFGGVVSDRYSCVYGFRQEDVSEGSLIPGSRDSLIGNSLVEGLSPRGAISSTGVAVDLNTEVEGVRRPGFPEDAMSSDEEKEQQYLENHNATNSNRVSEVSDPFADYSGGGGAAGGVRQAGSRNPLEEYLGRS